MGIKSSFNAFLKSICPEIFETIHLSEYAYRKIAIDISLYINKYKAIAGDNWKASFIKLIACLRRNQIHCVFIFDGKSPIEKDEEKLKRRNERLKLEKKVFDLEESLEEYHKTGIIKESLIDLYKKRKTNNRLLNISKEDSIDIKWIEEKIKSKRSQLYEITPEDYENIKKIFDILKVPYFIAPWEAEKMCAKLNIDGIVDAVLSEDTDVMAYGTPCFLSKIDTSQDICVSINKDKLLTGLDLTYEQFLDLCIMCGTDYNENIPKIGSKTAYKHICKYKSIEDFSTETKIDIAILKHIRVRELFTYFENEDVKVVPYCGHPDFELLEKFIKEHNIYISFEQLRKDFTLNILVFEESDDYEIESE